MKWLLILLVFSVTAQAKYINKCVINGKTVYMQRKCPEGSSASMKSGTFNTIDTNELARQAEEERKEEEREKRSQDIEERKDIADENRQIQNEQQQAIEYETNSRLRRIERKTDNIQNEQQHRRIMRR